MEKSSDAFRTISEVADDLDLPQHVLRFWETRFPQIRPLKRAGGRRYYRPADIAVLRTIRTLLYDQGYTIKGVQRVLKEKGARVSPEAAAPPAPREPFFESLVPGPVPDVPEAGADAAVPPDADGRRALMHDALATLEACLAILAATHRPR